ncbi:hypothetical protein CFB41_23540 [Burkholderia sp. AU33803]|nr:hypothetical protein CFB41_23540 [Burkholderia sp. AU33803]PRD86132.1 hypothetical protein C6P88_31870 [Burkholderia contaminans]
MAFVIVVVQVRMRRTVHVRPIAQGRIGAGLEYQGSSARREVKRPDRVHRRAHCIATCAVPGGGLRPEVAMHVLRGFGIVTRVADRGRAPEPCRRHIEITRQRHEDID